MGIISGNKKSVDLSSPLLHQAINEIKDIYGDTVIVPKNSDVIMTAQSSSTSQRITGDISGFLAKVV